LNTDAASARALPHTFGPWSFELRGEELADIAYLDRPVLRGIRPVVRNHNWSTLTPRVTRLSHRERDRVLALLLEIRWEGFDAAYTGQLEFGIDHSSINAHFRGTAVENFSSNRIGLIVLHRPDEAGRRVQVTSPDGSLTPTAFPEHVAPHQPFRDIAALSWERDGSACRLDFEGDVFETEDQRNWTDASFKTYSTPLARPFPVLHREGDDVVQQVRLSARRELRISSDVTGTVPLIGTSADPRDDARAREKGLVRGPLLAEVATIPDAARATVSRHHALALAEAYDVGLDLRLVAGSADEVRALISDVALERVDRIAAFDPSCHITTREVWQALQETLESRGYRGELLAGARSHFAELNRNPDAVPASAHAVTYSITPQMHAVEERAIVETLPLQTLTARNALRISGGRPVHIGPITMTPRFNAVATEASPVAEQAGIEPSEQFVASWLIGSVASLTLPGVNSLSYFSSTALQNVAGRLLEQLGSLYGCPVLANTGSPDGNLGEVALYPVRTLGGLLFFVANLTPQRLDVRIVGPCGGYKDLTLDPWGTFVSTLD
jgi:hypothetical protein